MNRRSRALAFAALAGLSSTGCGKKPTYVHVDLPNGTAASDVEGSVSGRAFKFYDASGGTPAFGIASWSKDETAPKLVIDLSLRTPCGKKKLPVSLPDKPYTDDKFERRYKVAVADSMLENRTELWIDPSLGGNLKLGELELPKPLPKKLTVTFASCPRVVTVRGQSVPIPETRAGSAVLLADSKETCYLDGEVRFGNDPSCRPDSSKRLTGQSAYVLGAPRTYLFEGVPMSAQVTRRTGKCLNESYLQRCP